MNSQLWWMWFASLIPLLSLQCAAWEIVKRMGG